MFPRFSPKEIKRMKEALRTESMDEIWASHVSRRKAAK